MEIIPSSIASTQTWIASKDLPFHLQTQKKKITSYGSNKVETILGSTVSTQTWITSKDLPFHLQTQKRKVKEKPFNFLLHRFGIEINQ